jgi:hypothetical protein
VAPGPHLNDQFAFHSRRDHERFALIASIKCEELCHLDHAEKNLTWRGPIVRTLRRLIDAVTEVLIFMSTLGDSVRMARALAANRRVQVRMPRVALWASRGEWVTLSWAFLAADAEEGPQQSR